MIRVFIGYDHVEEVAYHTLCSSIIRYASQPVSITPVALHHLKGIVDRPRDEKQSNEFSFSRFIVPYLCDYEGWAIFMDCDMIVRRDIAELWALRDETKAVQLCKHEYTPVAKTKFLGNVQHHYPRKNWSSMMLMNTARCKALTVEYVNAASGLDLHRFNWLSDELIGSLPWTYNWLVGEYHKCPDPAILHYTIGGPYFDEYRKCDYAREWFEEYEYMTHVSDG